MVAVFLFCEDEKTFHQNGTSMDKRIAGGSLRCCYKSYVGSCICELDSFCPSARAKRYDFQSR
jgi:hypothetical protein